MIYLIPQTVWHNNNLQCEVNLLNVFNWRRTTRTEWDCNYCHIHGEEDPNREIFCSTSDQMKLYPGGLLILLFFLIRRCKQFDKTPKDHGSSGCRLIVCILIILSNIIHTCELYCSELTEGTKNHQLLYLSIITHKKSIQTG